MTAMAASSALPASGTLTVVEIPGEPTLAHAVVPNVKIALPLQAWNGKVRLAISAVILAVVFVPGGLAAFLLLLGIARVPFPTVSEILTALIFAPLGVLVMVFAGGAALTCIIDLFRRGPVLALDGESLQDNYAGVAIPWATIAQVQIVYAQSSCARVKLRLRNNIQARHCPFRIGLLGTALRRRPDELHISVKLLDKHPRVVAYAIATLAKLHGGEIVT